MIQFSRQQLAVLRLTVAVLMFPAVVFAGIAAPIRPGETTTFEKMRQGVIPPTKDKMEEMAKWLAYRLVEPPFNGKESPTKTFGETESIETLMDDVERACRRPDPRQPPNDTQIQFAKAFGKEMELAIMEVMDDSATQRLEKVNAARMLAIVGKLYYEGTADTYLKIIRDDKYPLELKRYAFEGLRNLLSIPHHIRPNQHFITNNPKLAEICEELEKSITKKLDPNLTTDEIRVVQFVRREAVRALAQMKNNVIRQQTAVLAKPIWTLLRVATNDSIVAGAAAKKVDDTLPGYPYNILERIEAIIGICSMNPDKNLNVDLVAYLINDALLDIVAFQNAERARYLKDPRNKPLVPWKIMAFRLIDAMNLWKETTAKLHIKNNPVYAANLVDPVIQKCLNTLYSRGVEAEPDNRPLINWKNDRKPKSTQVLAEDESTTPTIK